MMFDAVPSKAIGLEWEPAHQMVQLIDPLPQLEQWIDRVYHLHGKDVTLHWDPGEEVRASSAPRNSPSPAPPATATPTGGTCSTSCTPRASRGDLVVEGFHDPIFKDDREWAGQLHALQYLKWCRGGTEVNPWKPFPPLKTAWDGKSRAVFSLRGFTGGKPKVLRQQQLQVPLLLRQVHVPAGAGDDRLLHLVPGHAAVCHPTRGSPAPCRSWK